MLAQQTCVYFLALVLDFYASRVISGQKLGSLMTDGFTADVSACHERCLEKDKFKTRDLVAAVSKQTQWPKTLVAKVPIMEDRASRCPDGQDWFGQIIALQAVQD